MIRYLPNGEHWNTAVFSTREGATTVNHGSLTFNEKVTVRAVLEACGARLRQRGQSERADELAAVAAKVGDQDA